jgi:sulfide:quinone oxidoreductase
MANTPIKCAGAPLKIMFLFEEHIRSKKIPISNIEYWTPDKILFGVKKYCSVLDTIAKERGIEVKVQQELVTIDSKHKIATFKSLETGKLNYQKFDILHVTPPMSAPDFIKKSLLSDAAGDNASSSSYSSLLYI